MVYFSQGKSPIFSPANMKTLANFMVSSPMSTVYEKQILKRVCICVFNTSGSQIRWAGRTWPCG